MSIIVNSQPQPGKTTEYRLSIQADLNGFSFSVTDDRLNSLLYLYSSDFVMDRGDPDSFAKKSSDLFYSQPLLRSKYKNVDLIYNTEKFTSVPKQLHKFGDEINIMSKLFKIEELEEINIREIPKEEMVLLFAVNSTFLNVIKEHQPTFSLYPSAYVYLSYLPLFKEYNKIFFQYQKGFTTILAAEGERIVFSNTFPASHFNSALYFLLLVLKEVQFNPEQTSVYISGNIRDLEIYDIAKYFSKVKYFRNPAIPLSDQFAEMRYSTMMFQL